MKSIQDRTIYKKNKIIKLLRCYCATPNNKNVCTLYTEMPLYSIHILVRQQKI